MKEAVVIGAGISGLALAWYLKQNGVNTLVIEKSNRPGGWVQSSATTGFLFEQGPRSLRPNARTLDLIHSLGIDNEKVEADAAAKKRFIYTNNKLRSVPFAFWLPIFKGLWRDWFTPPANYEDESIHSFFCRRFGIHFAEVLGDSMVNGIYAGDPTKLSIKHCFPGLYRMEQQYGSLTKGFLKNRSKSGSIFSFKKGMQTLTDALASHAAIEYQTHPIKIIPHTNYVDLVLNNGATISTEHLYLALPSSELARYFPEIKATPSASIATINIGYKKDLIGKKGFGYLIPSIEKQKVLGVVFDSATFPQQNHLSAETRLTVMAGGSRHPHIVDDTEESLIELTLKTLEKQLALHETPDSIQVKICRNAIPQYPLNHEQNLKIVETQIAKRSKRIHPIGSSFYGVAINDCIEKAYQIAVSH